MHREFKELLDIFVDMNDCPRPWKLEQFERTPTTYIVDVDGNRISNDKVWSYILLLEAEVEKLTKDSEFLARLRAAGVDNWEGYESGFAAEEDDDDE